MNHLFLFSPGRFLLIALLLLVQFLHAEISPVPNKAQVVLLNSLAEKNYDKQTTRSKQHCRKVISLTSGNSLLLVERCQTFIVLGRIHLVDGRLDSAQQAIDSATYLQARLPVGTLAAELLHLKGNLSRETENYQEGLTYYFQAIDLCRSSYLLGRIYNDIGVIYRFIEDDDAAMRFFQKSYKVGISTGDSLRVAKTLNNISSVYRSRKHYPQALELLKRSLAIRRLFNDSLGMISCWTNMGLVHEKLGNDSLALRLHQNVSAIADRNQWIEDEVIALINCSNILLRQRQVEEVENNLIRALKIAQTHQLYYLGKRACLLLAEYYRRQGDFKQAYDFQQQSSTFTSENAKEELQKSTMIQEIRFRDKENKQMISLLQSRNTAAELQAANSLLLLERRRILLWLLVAGLVVVAAGLWFVLRRNREQSGFNRQLVRLVEEKELLLREIHHRVKNNLQLVSSLLNLNTTGARSSTSAVLRQSQDRIHTLALLHEHLYQSKNLNEIRFSAYVNQLVNALCLSFHNPKRPVQVVCDVSDIRCDIDQMVPCGLIINELVTNSLKHAFSENTAAILAVHAHQQGDELVISVTDNGKGISPVATEQLGLRLVKGLVRQLKGKLTCEPALQEGTRFTFIFPLHTSIPSAL